jgi:hypothetical protein
MGANSKSVSFEAIIYLIHHIFLPPQLPQKDDYNLKHEKVLLDLTCKALSSFKACMTSDHSAVIDPVRIIRLIDSFFELVITLKTSVLKSWSPETAQGFSFFQFPQKFPNEENLTLRLSRSLL